MASLSLANRPAHPIEWLDSIASTNETAMQSALAGATGPLWIAARRQSGGRGRAGRHWESPPGNLYASLLLTLGRPPPVIAQLALVSAIAVHAAIGRLAPGLPALLKWPNDVLIEGAKICGVLIESQRAPANDAHNVVVGIGLNLAHHPKLPDRRATSLAAHGVSVDPPHALRCLAESFDDWLAVWAEGSGFADIRGAWQARATGLGCEVTVKSGGEVIAGRFRGLDADGAMLLETASGQRRRITFGDVHIGAAPRAGT